jgi:hypothetical protein
MSMLRLPAIIYFPLLFWSNKKIQQEAEAEAEEEEVTRLLIPEEVKHHGSIKQFYEDEHIEDIAVIDQQKDTRYSFFEIKQELMAILKFGIPLIVTFLLGFGNRVVDVWFLGQVGSEGR